MLPAAGDMLKPVAIAAFALLNPPGWSVSPAYFEIGTDEVHRAPVLPVKQARPRLAGLA